MLQVCFALMAAFIWATVTQALVFSCKLLSAFDFKVPVISRFPITVAVLSPV